MALQNGREENGEWNTLRLTLQRDGTNFNQFTQDACLVKVTKDIFYILGGRKSSNEPAISKVFMINMKEQSVKEVGSLLHPRAQHACAIIAGEPSEDLTMTSSQLILVTGGTLGRFGKHLIEFEFESFYMSKQLKINRVH